MMNMQSNNSSDDDPDGDPEFNNRALDVFDYNLEDLNLNISLNSSHSQGSNNNNLLKVKVETDVDDDDCPVLTDRNTDELHDKKPLDLLESSNMDIQTARGPDAPEEAFLNEDSM